MPAIGKYNSLEVIKTLDFGVYLDGKELGEILVPLRYVPEGTEIGDELDCFLYYDSEDRIIATTEKPAAQVDEFAFLQVVSASDIGAFLDWGLPKDLLVPFREQKEKMQEGRFYMVKILLDHKTNRIYASAKIDKYLDNEPPQYEYEQLVKLQIISKTDLGYKAIINNAHTGVLYYNEVFRPLKSGDRLKGYIKNIREDGKIDLMLNKPGYETIEDIAGFILYRLEKNNGVMEIGDNTDAEIIYNTLGISKKSFKKAVGLLYKQKKITIEPYRIKIVGN